MLRATHALMLTLAAAVILSSAPPAAAHQDKETEYSAQLLQGDAALAKRQWEEALKAYKRANSLQEKKSAAALAGMGRAYYGMGAYKSALDSWTDALKYAGDDTRFQATCRNQRGMSLFSIASKATDKKVTEAEAEFRAAMALDPDLPVARYNLGVALMRQSRDEEGAAELKAFLASPSRGPEVNQAKKLLENPRRARENFAPDVSFVTLDQQHISLEDLKGKVVLLDFWASWCGPCKAAVPGLRRINKKYSERAFTIISVSLDRTEQEAHDFIQKNQMTWPQYFDKTRKIAGTFGVQPIPTYVLLDDEGRVVERQEGWDPSFDGYLDKKIDKLLKKAEELGKLRRPD